MNDIAQLVEQGKLTDPQSARGRLLAKAANLFKEKGYERTTVRDLAAAVGIQSGSIFHHFRTKEDILLAVMEETIRYITSKMEDALGGAESARDRLLALIRCELECVLGGTGEAMTVLVYEWRSLSESNQRRVLVLRDRYERLWMNAVNDAKEAGLIKSDPFILRRFLTGALSWTITWYKADGSISLDKLAEQALQLAIKD